MSKDRTILAELEDLVLAVVEHDLSPAQRTRLAEILRDNPWARGFYSHYLELHVMLEWEASGALAQTEEVDPLLQLLKMEHEAEGELVHWHTFDEEPNSAHAQTPRSLPQLIARPMAWGSFAAMMFVGLILWMVVQGFGPEPTQTAQITTTEQSPVEEQVVAYLTATHDAKWFGKGHAVGSELYAEQQLVLSEGYAQITTLNGAVAILEGPCKISLSDHPNALRLIRGKLTGICETESSKGFVVRTSGMDVIDLGTRFGVQSQGDQTFVKVFEGKVVAEQVVSPGAPKPNSSARVELSDNQQALVTRSSPEIKQVDTPPADVTGFARSWRTIANPPRLTGDIRYQPSVPDNLSVGAFEKDVILLFPEREGMLLEQGVEVNISAPGTYINETLQQTTTLHAEAVDVYLVHLDIPSDAGASHSYAATIEFDRPIVGVMTSAPCLVQSHAVLGQPGVIYPGMGDDPNAKFSGLDMSQSVEESVFLSDDRRSLRLQLAAGLGVDQVRILVERHPQP